MTDTGPRLVVSDLGRRFGGLRAVDGLSLELRAGEILGLLGPNGSGKTTAINLISGLLKPDSGSVRLDGEEIAGAPAHRIARKGVARTFQLVRVFPGMTALENVLAGMAFADPPRFGAAAETEAVALLGQLGLGASARTRADQLNYIDQKRLEMARALAGRPRVLLLDEWLAGLNPTELASAIELVAGVKRSGLAILMVEHVIEAVRALCDSCVVMNAGMPIAAGSPDSVLGEPAVIEAYLGSDDDA